MKSGNSELFELLEEKYHQYGLNEINQNRELFAFLFKFDHDLKKHFRQQSVKGGRPTEWSNYRFACLWFDVESLLQSGEVKTKTAAFKHLSRYSDWGIRESSLRQAYKKASKSEFSEFCIGIVDKVSWEKAYPILESWFAQSKRTSRNCEWISANHEKALN